MLIITVLRICSNNSPRPEELAPHEPLSDDIGGCLFEGSKGKLLCGIFGSNPTLLPTKRMATFMPPPQKILRVKESHQRNWVKAIKEGTPTTAPFDFACKLTETILIGNLAVRSFNLPVLKPGKRKGQDDAYHFGGRIRLDWDASQMKVTNLDEANQFVKRNYRQGWYWLKRYLPSCQKTVIGRWQLCSYYLAIREYFVSLNSTIPQFNNFHTHPNMPSIVIRNCPTHNY